MPVELHHRIEGDGPVVVLASSLGTTLAMWDAQAAALRDRFRVLRFDHRGHGDSPAPPGPYAMDELAEDVVALLDRLAIPRASLCGISMGGMVCMEVALRAPERVDALVLACTRAYFGPPETWTDRAASVRTHGMQAIAPAVLDRWFTGSTPPEIEAMLLGTPPEGYAGCCEAMAGHDLREQIGSIRAPTLVIAASDDPSTPADQVATVAGAIPGARLELIENAAHLANVERPEEFNRALMAFLAP